VVDDEPARRDGVQTDGATGDDGAVDERGVDLAPRKRRKGSHRKAKPPRPFWVEALALIVVAVVIALGVHTFMFQAFYIPSGSMENTLHIGDRVLVNKLSYTFGHVQRGQIIVFNGEDSWDPEVTIKSPSNVFSRIGNDIGGFLGFSPSDEKDYIKRVIGIPGDRITCCDAQGRILVNGVALDENYLFSGPQGHVEPTTTKVNESMPFDIVVPPGRLWVEGDHRDDSKDSRMHLADPGGGTIPESRVVGRAFVIVWPIGHWRGLGIPGSYHSLSSAMAAGAPYGIGALAVAPIGLLRLRRRRRRRAASTTRCVATSRARRAAT